MDDEPTVEMDATICAEVDPTYTLKCGHPLSHDGDHSWELGQELGVSILMPKPPTMTLATDPNQIDAEDGGWESMLYHLENLLGFRLNEEEETHLRVLLTALQKYHERDSQHRGLWRYFGAIDSAHQARAKATRTYNNAVTLLKNGEGELEIDPMDDAIDLVNYAVFFMRNVREGNYGG